MKCHCKSLIVALLISFPFRFASAQTPKLDTLQLKLQNHPQEDSLRSYWLMLMADELKTFDSKASLAAATQSLRIAKKIQSPVSIVKAYFVMGKAYDDTEHADSAVIYLEQSAHLAHEIGAVNLEIKASAQLGVVEMMNGNYEKSMQIYQDLIPLIQQSNNNSLLAMAYSNIASIFFEQENYQKSLEYDLKSYRILLQKEDYRIIQVLSNVGQAYGALGKHDSALFYMKLSVNKALEYNDSSELAYAYSSLGDEFNDSEIADSALGYFQRALAIYDSLTIDAPEVGATIGGLAEAYLQKKDYENAIQYFLQSEAILTNANYQDQLEYILKGISETYAGMGNYQQAWEYANKYTALHDTLNAIAKTKATAQLERKFNLAQKEQEIELLNQEKLLQTEAAKQQRLQKNILIAGIVALLLIAFLLLNRYQIKRRAEKQLQEQNKVIAEQKQRAENEQLRAEKSEQFKAQFLANMSHEIRTPMNAISGFTNLLFDAEDETKRLQYLNAIKKSTDNLLVVINDVLDLSKLEAGKMQLQHQPFRLQDVLNFIYETFELKAAEKKLQWKIQVDDGVPALLYGDAARLTQVLMNLAGNAIKFTISGSVQLQVSTFKISETITFKVTDTGPGIPHDQQRQIFESFAQAGAQRKNAGGTGLGLTISKNLVSLMGGTLEVESEEGLGAAFSFTIPYTLASEDDWRMLQQNELEYEEDIGEALRGISILVAEDNEYNQLLIHDTLLKYIPDVSVEICNNGQEVLTAISTKTESRKIEALLHDASPKANASPQEYHIILMDVQMPEMDGYETTAYIRNQMGNHIPIIALTASVIKSDIDRCIRAGMNAYVPKPFSAKELLQSMANLLGKSLPSASYAGFASHSNHHDAEIAAAPVSGYQWIRLDHLQNLVAGDPEQIKRYLKLFSELIPARMSTLSKALETGDYNLVRKTVHVMKPQMASLGMARAKKMAETIESNYHREERIPVDAAVLLDECAAALLEVKRELEINR